MKHVAVFVHLFPHSVQETQTSPLKGVSAQPSRWDEELRAELLLSTLKQACVGCLLGEVRYTLDLSNQDTSDISGSPQ